MIACMHGHPEVVSCLQKKGANLGLEDIEGKTARDHAIEALEFEISKGGTDLKSKSKVAELQRIKNSLPDEHPRDVVSEEETP